MAIVMQTKNVTIVKIFISAEINVNAQTDV